MNTCEEGRGRKGKEETEREDKEGLGGGDGGGVVRGEGQEMVGKQGRTPKLHSANKELPLLYGHQVYT